MNIKAVLRRKENDHFSKTTYAVLHIVCIYHAPIKYTSVALHTSLTDIVFFYIF